MLERLPRPLEPDRLEILKGRHARMLDEEPQQVPLCGVPGLRERRHVPVTLGLIDDRVLHPMHRRMKMPSMQAKGRLLRIPIRAPEIHHHVLGDTRRQRFPALLGDEVQRDIDPRRDAGTRCDRAIHARRPGCRSPSPAAPAPAARAAARGASCSAGRRAVPRAPRAACPSRSSPGDALRSSSRSESPRRAVQPARGGRDFAGVTWPRCSVG